MFEGFKLSKFVGLRMVEVNMDSTLVIMAIEEGTIRDMNYVAIFWSINQLIKNHEAVIIFNILKIFKTKILKPIMNDDALKILNTKNFICSFISFRLRPPFK